MLVHHRVRRGDTLRTIAYQYYKDGELWSLIYRHNKHYIADPNMVSPGQVIVIPHKGSK